MKTTYIFIRRGFILIKPIHIIFIITVYISITLTNCNQCETNECSDGNTKNRISNVVKKYFYFKVGSWWVYENEISLERDSIYVVHGKIERRKGFESCNCEELLSLRDGSSLDDSLFYYTEANNSPSISFMKRRLGSSFRELTYRFDVKDDSSFRLENSHNGIISILKTYKGINEEFKNVYRCFYNIAVTDYLSDSYFAPNVGLIRYTLKNGDASYWNLVNYHIIQ